MRRRPGACAAGATRARCPPVDRAARSGARYTAGVSAAAYVVTLLGPDRPGLVERVSAVALEHGANWEASRLVRLGGRFAGVLLVRLPPERAGDLRAALAGIGDLRVAVDEAGADPDAPGDAAHLEVVGHDRPGIVRAISRVLAAREVNVEELETACASAPMTGEPLFRMTAALRLPPNVSVDDLRAALEALAHDLMVDIAIE